MTYERPTVTSQYAWRWRCLDCDDDGWTSARTSARFSSLEHVLFHHMPITWVRCDGSLREFVFVIARSVY